MPRKRKSNAEPFTIIPRRTLLSSELNSLSKSAFKIYIVLCSKWSRHNPDNDVVCTYNELIELNIQSQAISNAIKELINAGFIEKHNQGGLLRNPNSYKLNADWLVIKNNFQL